MPLRRGRSRTAGGLAPQPPSELSVIHVWCGVSFFVWPLSLLPVPMVSNSVGEVGGLGLTRCRAKSRPGFSGIRASSDTDPRAMGRKTRRRCRMR